MSHDCEQFVVLSDDLQVFARWFNRILYRSVSSSSELERLFVNTMNEVIVTRKELLLVN